jgi:GTP-binding protein HflX
MSSASSSSFRFEQLGADPTAVVAAVQLPGTTAEQLESSVEELERLATTLGLRVVGRVTQRRGSLAPGKVLGDGKLKELAAWTGGTGVVERYQKPGSKKADESEDDESDSDSDSDTDSETETETDSETETETDSESSRGPSDRAKVILVDHELTPTQQRNLEKATGVDVLDRTSVILEIFQRHAKTREARLQVEIARLKYLAPRLRESGGGEDRVRGGVGGKGAGESTLELDRRRIRDRIAELRHELAQIEGGAHTRRARRGDLPTVALVGYTNAGKSSLMRALTGSDVYIADKLFATLDTTVRALHPRTEPPILVTDTVGFIKQLPHDLVASFRSTLDEAREADLLLHVVDAADPAMLDQIQVTRDVLGELGVDNPTVLVLNKADKLDADARADVAHGFPDAIVMSAKAPADVARLRERLIEQFAGALEETELVVPWTRQALVSAIHGGCTVLGAEHDEDGTTFRVRAPARVIEKLRAALAA